MQFRAERTHTRAFTLIEVLTVIGILCVLAAILFPAMSWARGRALHTACADNLHQLGVAEHLYAGDHDGWVPPATTAANAFFVVFDATPAEVAASPAVLRKALDPYVASNAVWYCPADKVAHKNVVWLGMNHQLSSYWIYPINDGAPRGQWPPRMQLMGNNSDAANGVPLICDAVGIPDRDSAAEFATGDGRAETIHPDSRVNIVRHDLSLERKTANFMMGIQQ